MRIVLALGGNALLRRGDPMTTEVQRRNVRIAAHAIAPLAAEHDLVVVHGNGPQVGLLSLQAEAYDGAEPYPLDVLDAGTQGMIGYLIQQELRALLPPGSPVVTLLTMVAVDPADPAFGNPTKFVGPVYEKDAADALAAARGWSFRQDGAAWRRVVPSPRPVQILEIRPVTWLLERGAVVICAGGGGIPTVLPTAGSSELIGVEAVIDKDFASELLAEDVGADLLVMATDVDGVYLGWGTTGQRRLGKVTAEELAGHEFPAGSMGPKVEAATRFATRTGKRAAIGALDDIAGIVSGTAGTSVVASPAQVAAGAAPGNELTIGGIRMAVQSRPAGPPDAVSAPWYTRTADEALAALDVDPVVGLSAARTAELLAANGPNALPEEQPVPGWQRFIAQYRTYMQIILIVAAVVSLAIKEWSTGIVLIGLTVLNAVVGLRQEGKAESAMNALKSMMKATARVRRDGTESQIPATDVVVGDVVLLSAGDEVPADGRIIEASALTIDEAALTGESTPAAKNVITLHEDGLAPGDQTNMAFMNTPVTHGSGLLVVTAVGAGTEVGKISGLLSTTAREESPLTRELNRLTLWIAAAAGLTMIVMFALGRARGQAWDHLFTAAVSLAIAAIPEALPTVAQVILSVGGTDLAKRNAIVKDLPSVETLGFTSAINSDKTGTLTMNQMTAVEVLDPTDRYTISGTGYSLDGTVLHAAGSTATLEDAILPYLVASDAKLVDGHVVGDPTEGALLVLGSKAGLDIDATREELPRLATLPFDPSYKLMATFNTAKDSGGRPVVRCFIKGAAPAVMARAASALSAGAIAAWDAALSERATAAMERMESEGRRVMAAAIRDLDPAEFDPKGDLLALVTDVTITSLVAMVDPPREESKDAVASAQAAHIRVRMVTGDDMLTGAAIARQLGIEGEAILGADFAAMSEAERLERIDDIGVVGRVAPEHKVLLANTLKQKGHVVAMTGDGVNDAPAIKAADIGIAMGSGTEVAKNAGRMILSDDNFATIVFAVEQGRKIYDNLTKYIRFVLVLLVVFVLTFLGATLFNIAAGEPFTPAQVLWIHFFVNAPFGFALGFDNESPGLMLRRPRPRGESVLTHGLTITVCLAGLAITIGLLSMIAVGQHVFGSVQVGQSIAFTSFALCLIVAAVECRSESGTVLTTDTFDSKQLNWVMLGEFILAVFVTQLNVFNRILGTVPLNLREFGWALLPAIALLALWELGKLIARRSPATPAAT